MEPVSRRSVIRSGLAAAVAGTALGGEPVPSLSPLERARQLPLRPKIRDRVLAGQQAILDELKPTRAQLDRGLELHYHSPVADMQGNVSVTNWPYWTVGLVCRGLSDDEIRKIIGGNFLRYAKQVLGKRPWGEVL